MMNIRSILFFLPLLFLSGCYSFKGISIDPEVKTFFVQNFESIASNAPPTLALDFTEKVLRTVVGVIKQDSDLLNDNPWLAMASPVKITYGFVKNQGEGGLPMKTPIKDDRPVQR